MIRWIKQKKIIRISIHTMLKHFDYFTTIPVLLLLPFSASVILSETIHGLSSSSHQIIKSHTVFPFVFTLFLSISSFIISKASIIKGLNPHKPCFQAPFSSLIISVYKPLLLTHLSSLAMDYLIIFFISMYSLQPYISLIHFNSDLVSNLALVTAGMGTCKGPLAIYKACLLLKNCKKTLALLLFLPTNLGLFAIKALFKFRVMRIYRMLGNINATLALEGLLTAYLYCLLIVLDTIICCIYYKSFESNSMTNDHQINGSCYDLEFSQERCTSSLPEKAQVLNKNPNWFGLCN